MTIKQSQVDSLHDGDVIELRDDRWPGDSVVRGPVVLGDYGFVVGPILVTTGLESLHLTVVSKAPRPLYVNHPRTEPAMGDVVADVGNGGADWTWHRVGPDWLRADGADFDLTEMPDRLRLLVDGETGQVVP